MTTAYWLLALFLGIILYVWVVYPLLVFVLAFLFPFRRGSSERRYERKSERTSDPSVTIIIAVHNEQQKIAAKLGDCLDLLYPRDRLDILVASDGSTDRTEEIVRRFAADDSRIQWLQNESRLGKSGVQNLAAQQARGELLFFTDANTAMTPGVLRTMIDNLSDPAVGLVTATVLFGHPEDAVEKGQGFYWRFELFLRGAESRLGILATGSGQALLVRRELFQTLPTCYGDDCILPLDVRLAQTRRCRTRLLSGWARWRTSSIIRSGHSILKNGISWFIGLRAIIRAR